MQALRRAAPQSLSISGTLIRCFQRQAFPPGFQDRFQGWYLHCAMIIRSARLNVPENWLIELAHRTACVDITVPDNFPWNVDYRIRALPRMTRLAVPALVWTALLAVSDVRAQQSNADLDGDGVVDALDLDQDNDGIVNSLEGLVRLEDLSGLDAVFFAARPDEQISRGLSRDYDIVSTENGGSALLTGQVLSTDTDVEWAVHDTLPKLRNLGSGTTTVQWTVTGEQRGEQKFENIDFTISDLDGARSETVAVSASSIAGYSLSLNSNVLVSNANGVFSFTGTGVGGDSTDDLVTLHFRNSPLMEISYSNNVQTPQGDVAGISANGEIVIAGYRHSLERVSSTFYTPVTRFRDTDGDGVSDHRDLDSDNDGLGDVIEAGGLDLDHNNLIDGAVNLQGLSASVDPDLDDNAVAAVYAGAIVVQGADSDSDGLLLSVDGSPSEFGGSLAGTDSDGDGLTDLDEVRIHQTNPDEPDSDADGLDDLSEVRLFLTDPLLADTDGDTLSDGDEVNVHNTDPGRVDSDADGTADGKEVERGTDPLQAEPVIVSDPVPPLELTPVVGPEEDAAPVINPSAEEDATMADSEVEMPLFDDPQQAGIASLRTGPGCSSITHGAPAPLMLMMLLMAFGCLHRKRVSGSNEQTGE